jgi:GT2 family glycosyltransferase
VDALAVMALTAVANPDACFFYSDEDKIDAFGVRSEPHFKPDLNRTLALACNYFCHLSMYKSETVNQVGLFESEYDGAQDYDFALRMLSVLDDSQVIHVPYVLYHWRTLPNSTSSDSQAKPYALAASRGAVARYLEREGINAKVIPEPKLPFFNRVTPDLIERPMISIIIPTRDKSRVLAKCIDSVLTKTTYSPFEIIIVDNESQETETIEYFESLTDPRIRILKYPHPFNYSAINNFAVSKANGSYICLLNNDTEVLANDWLEQMLGYAQLRRTGAVGAKLLFPDGRLQHGGVILGLGGLSGVAGHAHRLLGQDCSGYMARASLAQEFSAVTAACLMVSKQKFLEAGGLSEELTVAFNDVDFCLKLLDVGYKNIWTPHAQLLHYESYSRGLDTQEQQVQRAAKEVLYMRDKWAYLIDNDPAYNRHLTRNHDDFTLAWPPRKPPRSI